MFLSVLMVVSVFGATVALTGSAAAAQNPQFEDASPPTVAEDQNVNNQVVNFTVDALTDDGTPDTVTFTIPDRFADNNFDVNSAVTNASGGASNVTIVDGPDGDGVDDTIQYDVDGNSSATATTLGVNFNFTAPDVDSDTNLPVRFTLDDSSGDNVDITEGTVTIRNDATADVPSGRVLTADGDDPTFEDIVFQGQTVVATNFSSGETVNVRRVTGEDSDQLVREESANANGEVTLDTADLGQAGDFFFVGQGSTNNRAGFEHVIQTSTVEFEDDTVDNDAEIGDSTVNLTVDSNRAGSFQHNVTSSNLTDDELVQIFPDAVTPNNVDVDDDGETDGDGIRITAGQNIVFT